MLRQGKRQNACTSCLRCTDTSRSFPSQKDTLLVHDAYLPLRKLEHCFGARYDSTKVTRNVKFGDMQDGQAPDTASKRLAPWKIGAVVSSDATDDGWSD